VDAQQPLVVRSSGLTLGDEGDGVQRPYPTVVVDASARPDVADLARVHVGEGVGDLATSLVVLSLGPLAAPRLVIRLGIACTSPVRCSFALDLDVEEHRAVLEDIASSGLLLIATGDPPATGASAASGPHPPWLAVTLRGEAVTLALDAVDRHREA